MVFGRTAHYGGPFKITTGASLYEDSFEILTNSQRSRFGYLACLPALWLGKLRSIKGIEAWKATEGVCEAAGNEPVFAQVDGEPIGPAPISFRVVPDALSLLTPAPARTLAARLAAPVWSSIGAFHPRVGVPRDRPRVSAAPAAIRNRAARYRR